MKTKGIAHTIFYFIGLFLLFGCKKQDVSPLPELIQAEALMFNNPDSALHILKTMPIPSARNKKQHALWCLLTTQAQFKLCLPFQSDSLIRIAYDYYRHTDNARRKAMSALYMGNVNYELKHITKAMNYFLEAKADIEKTNDYKLGYLVMSSLGNLYVYRNLTDYALEAFQEAYDYAVKDSCKRYEMTTLQDFGRTYSVRGEYERAIQSYNQAIQIRDSIHETFNSLESELADVYFALGNYEKALDLEKRAIKNNIAPDYYGIGETFLCLEEYDSAYYYLKKALHTSNVYTLAGVYEALLSLSQQPTYRQYMTDFCDSLLFYQDSIYALDKSETIIAYKEKYEHQKLAHRNQQLEFQTARWFLLSIIAVLCLIGGITYFYIYRKTMLYRKKEDLNRLTALLNKNQRLMARNNIYIAELEKRIAENKEVAEQLEEQRETLAFLREENQTLQQKNAHLQTEITSYKSTNGATSITEAFNQLQLEKDQLSALLIETHPYLTALHQHPICLSNADRNQICQLADTIYTGFRQRLLTSIPSLSEYEVLLCCLIKLHFSVSEIATLLAISPASVSTSKSRLKKKIYTQLKLSDEKRSFDTWIWEY